MNGEAIWDAALKIAEEIHRQAEMLRAIRKERRRAKARARYARRKAAGTLRPRVAAKDLEDDRDRDGDQPAGCSCSSCRMPPCSWCESQTEEA